MPTPNEIEVLRITKEEMEVDKALISSRMAISSEYSGHLLSYLAGKGFLEKVPAKDGTHKTAPRYKLTRKGALILLARLYHTAGQYASAARRTLFLKSAIDEKINEMTDYVRKEFPEKRYHQRKEEKVEFFPLVPSESSESTAILERRCKKRYIL